MLRALLSILAPPLCIVCGADAGRAAPVCRDCRAELTRTAIRGHAPAIHGVSVWSAFAYDGPAGAIVRELKFGACIPMADVMAAQLVAHAPPGIIDGTLVPVPAHPAR